MVSAAFMGGGFRVHTQYGGQYVFANAEAAALVARMTTQPTTVRKILIDALVGALKTAGVWLKLDALYVLAAHASQAALLNWVQDAYNLTAVNSPAFVADQGYTGDGSTSYLDTNFNPTTAVGAKFVQNSAHNGIWSRTNLNNGGASSNDAGALSSQIARQAAVSGNALGRANTGSGILIGAGAYPGHICWSRTAAAVWEGYAQGVDSGGGTDASVAITNANMRLLSFNGAAFGVNQLAVGHMGSGLSAAEVLATKAALLTYLQAIGAA
jgi:hypothetical protein